MDPAIDREARLRRLEGQLESISSQRELVEFVAAEVRNSIGYMSTWLGVFEEATEEYRILAAELSGGDDLWDSAVPIPIEGDPYIDAIRNSTEAQIIEDAQVAENVNREIVEQLGNRTIINIRIDIDGAWFGTLGTGTFGEEGPRPPDEIELEYLENVSRIAGKALSRVLKLAGHLS